MTEKICQICGKVITSSDECIELANEGEYVHGDCARRHGLARCECCHGYILPKFNRCNKCEELIYRNSINSYGTKPIPFFKNSLGDDGKEYPIRYYGLEMEFNHTDCEEIHDIAYGLYKDKWIYNKRDGSIDEGVEIVTSPMDRKSVKTLMDMMSDVFDYVENNDYSDNAGLHIHVTKKSIPVMDRYKLCILLNSNKTKKEKYIMYYLSGRMTGVVHKNIEDNNINDHYFNIGYSSKLCPRDSSHSIALNTGNSSTYEFRIFKSTNKPDVIMSYIEMVDTMIMFCHQTGIKDITVENYINWLKKNTKNKILLDKINTFENMYGCILSRPPVFLEENKIQILRGVNWKDYYTVVYIISTLGYKELQRENLKTYDIGSSKFDIKDDDICKRLMNTFRKCMIKEILKKQEGIEKCA